MANLANVATPNVSGTNKGTAGQGQSGAAQNPFTRAAIQHEEPCGYDVTRTLLAGSMINLPDLEIPAYGYLRYIRLQVDATGAAGTPTFLEDFPFNVLSNIILQEPNGAQLNNYENGWWIYALNKYGGYRYATDPRTSHTFGQTAAGNFTFSLIIPVEVGNREGLGGLPNQNSAAQFRVKLNLNAATSVYGTTQPTTLPDVRVRAFIMAYDQPEDAADGMSNATTPPAMNTTGFVTIQQFPVNQGAQNVRLTRVGNYMRNIIFVYKARETPTDPALRTTGDTSFPDPATLFYDTRPKDIVSRQSWLDRIASRYHTLSFLGTQTIAPDTPGGRDFGVFPYDLCHDFDGKVGAELRDQWMRTLSSTRLEIGGQWNRPGTLYTITNDIVPVGNVFL